MASVSRSVLALASLPASDAPMRASSGGPPSRKNSVNGMTDSHSKNDLVIDMAVLSPADRRHDGGLAANYRTALGEPARAFGDVVDAFEHFAQRLQARVDLAHGLRRACQPFGGRASRRR